MDSKEYLERIKSDVEINYLSTGHNNTKDKDNYLSMLNVIEKDLEQLGKYKDIEKEISIDFITLSKALKDGIWVKYDSDFGMTNKPKIKITKDKATGICYRDKKWYIQEDETLVKDYGKTWALTKEELL